MGRDIYIREAASAAIPSRCACWRPKCSATVRTRWPRNRCSTIRSCGVPSARVPTWRAWASAIPTSGTASTCATRAWWCRSPTCRPIRGWRRPRSRPERAGPHARPAPGGRAVQRRGNRRRAQGHRGQDGRGRAGGLPARLGVGVRKAQQARRPPPPRKPPRSRRRRQAAGRPAGLGRLIMAYISAIVTAISMATFSASSGGPARAAARAPTTNRRCCRSLPDEFGPAQQDGANRSSDFVVWGISSPSSPWRRLACGCCTRSVVGSTRPTARSRTPAMSGTAT